MTSGQLLKFANELRLVASEIAERHRSNKRELDAALWEKIWDPESREWLLTREGTFRESLASIRDAARFYQDVAHRGVGLCGKYRPE